jgi:hypothetical protein
MDVQTAHRTRGDVGPKVIRASTINVATTAAVNATFKTSHLGATITMVSDFRSRGLSTTTVRAGHFHISASSINMEASSPNERQSSRSSDPNLASQARNNSSRSLLYNTSPKGIHAD